MSLPNILNRLARPDYAVLPTTASASKHDQPSCCARLNFNFPRRYTRFAVAGLVGLLLYLFVFARKRSWPAFPTEAWPSPDGRPPLYKQYREYEEHLPAHNPDLPYPNGKHAKFIFFANHQNGVGWGNVLQEMIYNAYFAYHVKRSFVFYNYTWDMDGPDYADYNGHLIPSRIPLTALISGPMVGSKMGPNDADVPRAVSLDYFNLVCPQEQRHIINGGEVKQGLWNPTAKQLLNALVEKVHATDARCIELPQGTEQVFDYILFGSDKALDLWPLLRESPIFTQLGWSPLIRAAYKTNQRFFESAPSSLFASLYAPISKHFPKMFASAGPLLPPYDPLDGLLVIHIRRGDFDKHCWHFINYSSGYNGYNSFSDLPDRFVPPPGGGTPENADIYLRHCFPNVTQIAERVRDVRRRVEGLRKVYVMTNGKGEWLAELRAALVGGTGGEWDMVTTSRDLTLSWEQKPVSQTLDMYVAQRAKAFIGNGDG
ncbi:hypothetical protein APHAL10511_004150 [Amanita phalloides]|nr:hypothetical protein APHAL10511_004150 [Amanita phalloides]